MHFHQDLPGVERRNVYESFDCSTSTCLGVVSSTLYNCYVQVYFCWLCCFDHAAFCVGERAGSHAKAAMLLFAYTRLKIAYYVTFHRCIAMRVGSGAHGSTAL